MKYLKYGYNKNRNGSRPVRALWIEMLSKAPIGLLAVVEAREGLVD